jgi:DNA-binding GntR family transcriptional regulator
MPDALNKEKEQPTQRLGEDGGGERQATADELLPTQVANHIREQIISGRLKPRERIRQESIARECGTSRIPVRVALTQLEREGLVTLTSHVGARVAALDLAELKEIYLLRELVEPLALAESIPRAGEEVHEKLRGHVRSMEESAARNDLAQWVEVDRSFHLSSYADAPLPRFLGLIEGFWNSTQQYRRTYTRLPERLAIAQQEHRLLLQAIEHRDAEIAAEISRMHIRRTRLSLEEHEELFQDSPPSPGPR